MSSILTNNSAMTALQTLKNINSNLQTTQSQISTGKKVANAKDNAATFAISKVMESDVRGFKAISESLSLGESTVAVARDAAETTTELLTQMKEKIVAGQEDNVDRGKLQADVDSLKDQIASVVGAAQFNGLNLVDGSSGAKVDILSSLDRNSAGEVTASQIGVETRDLTGETGTTLNAAAFAAGTGDLNASSGTGALTFDTEQFLEADGAGVAGTEAISSSDLDVGVSAGDTGLLAGDIVKFTIGDSTLTGAEAGKDFLEVTTRVNEGDLAEDIQTNLKRAVDDALENAGDDVDFDGAGVANTDITTTITSGDLVVTNGSGIDIGNSVEVVRGEGGLAALDSLDVTTEAGATGALTDIEAMIQTSIDAAASFGTSQSRIETQSDFVSSLTDSMESGIGALVDANMEEASARLQALQVQQQLGTQALSIANQAPQSILSLFR